VKAFSDRWHKTAIEGLRRTEKEWAGAIGSAQDVMQLYEQVLTRAYQFILADDGSPEARRELLEEMEEALDLPTAPPGQSS
jgi:hypothetical protein